MNRDCGIVERFDTVAMAWHLVALAVVTAAASAAALAAAAATDPPTTEGPTC